MLVLRVLVFIYADGVFQVWLDPEQAERLAADIFSCRFDLPDVVLVNQPPKWRKRPTKVFISFSTTMPRDLGPRPSMDFLRHIEDPALRKEYEALLPALEKAQAAWDRKVHQRQAKKGKNYGFFAEVEEPEKR